jgi:hypothetical protein
VMPDGSARYLYFCKAPYLKYMHDCYRLSPLLFSFVSMFGCRESL